MQLITPELRDGQLELEMKEWDTHDWFDRPLEIDRAQNVTQFSCRKCGRGFIDDVSGRVYAIHASAFRVNRLSGEVTKRWLIEPSREEPQTSDR